MFRGSSPATREFVRLPSLRAAVVYPCSIETILGAIEIQREGLLGLVLIGPKRCRRGAGIAWGNRNRSRRAQPRRGGARGGACGRSLKPSDPTDQPADATKIRAMSPSSDFNAGLIDQHH